jgi:NAD(P) transhydrogenase subunit alpha
MKIFAARELHPGEKRVALNPASADKLVKLGLEVAVEAGIGQTIDHTDADYTAKGAAIASDRPPDWRRPI